MNDEKRDAWLAVFLSAFILQHSEFDFGSLAWVTGSLGEAVAAEEAVPRFTSGGLPSVPLANVLTRA